MPDPVRVALIAGAQYDRLCATLPDFTEAQGIAVEVGFQGDHPALNRHLASFDQPPYDLVSTHSKYAPAQMRFLASLDGLALDLSDFLPTALDLARINGALCGLPRNIDVRLLHWRTDLLPAPPRTWDELLAMARTATGLYGFACPGRDSGLFGTFYELCEMAGASLFPPSLVPDIENEGGRRALGLLRTLVQEQLVPPDVTAWHFDEVHRCFRDGRCLMVGDWPAFYALHRDPAISAVADRFAVSRYPAGWSGRSLSYGGGHLFALTHAGARRPEAQQLLAFLTAPEQQMVEARAGAAPVRHSVLTRMREEAQPRERERLHLLEQVIANDILIPPKFASYPDVEELLWREVQLAILGQTPIDVCLARIVLGVRRIVG